MNIEILRIIWLVLIAVLWTAYLVLDGFDLGVGTLLPVLGSTNTERRVMINTIGPVWDGNQVWLLTAGGATFAAFPLWYATMFSSFYLALLLILVALILRGVALEYRGKINNDRWRAQWDRALVVGSALPALLWGVAFGNLVHGVDADTVARGPFAVLLSALNPYSLLTGVVTLSLFLVHGALYVANKTTDELRERSLSFATRLSPAVAVIVAIWAVWTQLAYGKSWLWAVIVAAVATLGVTVRFSRSGRELRAFLGSSATIALGVVLIFGAMYPVVLPIHGGTSLTIHNASSTYTTLLVMTIVAVLMTPVIVAYQAWVYRQFRHRISTHQIPQSTSPTRLSLPKSFLST